MRRAQRSPRVFDASAMQARRWWNLAAIARDLDGTVALYAGGSDEDPNTVSTSLHSSSTAYAAELRGSLPRADFGNAAPRRGVSAPKCGTDPHGQPPHRQHRRAGCASAGCRIMAIVGPGCSGWSK